KRASAEDVALSRLPFGRCQEVPSRAVDDVDQAQGRVDDGLEPSVQVVEQQLGRSCRPGGTLYGRGVHADDVDAGLVGGGEHRALGLELRPLVVGEEAATVWGLLGSNGSLPLSERRR